MGTPRNKKKAKKPLTSSHYKKNFKEIKVMASKWQYTFEEPEAFEKAIGKDILGEVDIEARTIYFKGLPSMPTIIHEILHAFVAECCVQSCDLTGDQMEELCADLVAKRGDDMANASQTIYRETKKK